jgi:hypothetical protein
MTARDVEVLARVLHGAKPVERVGPSFNQWLRCVMAVARVLEYRADRPERFDLATFLTLAGVRAWSLSR